VQQRLNNLNMNTGPIDGILGPNTKAAIKAFQDLFQIKKSKDGEGIPDADQTQDTLWKVHDGPNPPPTPPPPPAK
jgi:peptidoglycan hydrolase-like protein with peptidoglycan-binding domain